MCNFLRTDGPCEDLDAFKKTCRKLAKVVATFCKCPANLPRADKLSIGVLDTGIDVEVSMPSVNYLMHPMSAHREVLKPQTGFGMTRVKGSLALTSCESIKLAVETILGTTDFLVLRFYTDRIGMMRALSANIRFDTLIFDVLKLTEPFAAFVRSLLQPASKLHIAAYGSDLVDTRAFLEELHATVRLVILTNYGARLLGQPRSFWQSWLGEKRAEGLTIAYQLRSPKPPLASPRLDAATACIETFDDKTDLTRSEETMGRVAWARDIPTPPPNKM